VDPVSVVPQRCDQIGQGGQLSMDIADHINRSLEEWSDQSGAGHPSACRRRIDSFRHVILLLCPRGSSMNSARAPTSAVVVDRRQNIYRTLKCCLGSTRHGCLFFAYCAKRFWQLKVLVQYFSCRIDINRFLRDSERHLTVSSHNFGYGSD